MPHRFEGPTAFGHGAADRENESITATIERYQIEAEISETYVVLHEFSCSREWIGLLLAQIFEGKRYKISVRCRQACCEGGCSDFAADGPPPG